MFVEYATEIIVSPEIVEKYKRLYQNMKNKNMKYNLVVTGNIGSGKSLRCELLYNIFNNFTDDIQCFPEYLNYSKHGKTMLKLRSKDLISPLTFQNYILDEWENMLKHKTYKTINIFERCPDDSVLCFSSNLPSKEYGYLMERLQNMNETYKCPTYKNLNNFTKIVSNDAIENIKTISEIIENDIQNGIKDRVIGLEISTQISYDRIMKRNRNSEKNLEMSVLNDFNKFYENLYIRL